MTDKQVLKYWIHEEEDKLTYSFGMTYDNIPEGAKEYSKGEYEKLSESLLDKYQKLNEKFFIVEDPTEGDRDEDIKK